MKNLSQHWDEIYQSKNNPDLGWFEKDGSTTLQFLKSTLDISQSILLTGAGTSTLVSDLLTLNKDLVLNDISKSALKKLSELNPSIKESPHQILADDLGTVSTIQYPQVDLWVDRAVLHFLIDTPQIREYFWKLRSSVNTGGHVMLAEFTQGGAEKCATLPIRQYTTEDDQEHLGPQFKLIKEMTYTFMNPRGEPRLYQYALFQRDV